MQQIPDNNDPNFGGVEALAEGAGVASYAGVPSSQAKASSFHNGLSREQEDAIDEIAIEISRLRSRIDQLGRSRCYSLAITKLEEAQHWIRARKVNAA